jgi:hypothetical protein
MINIIRRTAKPVWIIIYVLYMHGKTTRASQLLLLLLLFYVWNIIMTPSNGCCHCRSTAAEIVLVERLRKITEVSHVLARITSKAVTTFSSLRARERDAITDGISLSRGRSELRGKNKNKHSFLSRLHVVVCFEYATFFFLLFELRHAYNT